MTERSEYVLEPLREGADLTLYRGRRHGNPSPVLAVALSAEQPSPESLRRLEHEYSLAAELDPAWAATPLVLTRHEGRTILVLWDPGGIDAMKDMNGARELAIKSQLAENEQLLKRHGTGMGLRISRSIIESHGGRLWAAGNFPRGAISYLTLPTTSEAHQ